MLTSDESMSHEVTQTVRMDHVLQFYEDEAFLGEVVERFVASGLVEGASSIVIAREALRASVTEHLRTKHLDVERLLEQGVLRFFDPREVLDALLVEGMPDRDLFRERVGAWLDATPAGPPLRVYGEAVDLLLREGNPDAALRLEELWNELSRERPLSILCTHSLSSFDREADVLAFHRVCEAHSRVVPTERYPEAESLDARRKEISLLQQRAKALETEVEQRRRVEQELLEALRHREDFLSVAGHELKTPLTVLQLQLDSLADLARRDEAAEYQQRLKTMRRQVDRLGALTEELLDVSRLRAGHFELEREPLDLRAVVLEVSERLSPSAARAGSELAVHAPEPVVGSWDRRRMGQVVTHLLSNALKYGAGEPVEVSLVAANGRARLVVSDRGIGIPLEAQVRIFERFERAASSNNYGGLGLGLWIARQLVEAHEGVIRVESEEGSGATFTVELPASPGLHGPTGQARCSLD